MTVRDDDDDDDDYEYYYTELVILVNLFRFVSLVELLL